MKSPIDFVAEAAFARDLDRLAALVNAGVVNDVQASRIATRLASKTGAHLGALKAAVLVDLATIQSDV